MKKYNITQKAVVYSKKKGSYTKSFSIVKGLNSIDEAKEYVKTKMMVETIGFWEVEKSKCIIKTKGLLYNGSVIISEIKVK